MVSGAAREQALLGPMWAGLTPDSKGDPTGDTEEPDRRRDKAVRVGSSMQRRRGGRGRTGALDLRRAYDAT